MSKPNFGSAIANRGSIRGRHWVSLSLIKVSPLSVCNFLKFACYTVHDYSSSPADGFQYSHTWWLWLQVCGNSTRQADVSDMSGCGPQSTPSDMLWEGLLQSLPGWTQETLQHLSKLQADGTKLPWHQRWVNFRPQSHGESTLQWAYFPTLLWSCILALQGFLLVIYSARVPLP